MKTSIATLALIQGLALATPMGTRTSRSVARIAQRNATPTTTGVAPTNLAEAPDTAISDNKESGRDGSGDELADDEPPQNKLPQSELSDSKLPDNDSGEVERSRVEEILRLIRASPNPPSEGINPIVLNAFVMAEIYRYLQDKPPATLQNFTPRSLRAPDKGLSDKGLSDIKPTSSVTRDRRSAGHDLEKLAVDVLQMLEDL